MSIVRKKNRWNRPKVKINSEKLNEWFEKSPLNQKELAELCQVNPSTTSRWLRGERTPSVSEQQKLCEITGISFKNLFYIVKS